MIYLDNAATTWPKPGCVLDAMLRCMREVGANPGRSGHRLAVEAERIRFDAREALAQMFHVRDPLRVIFTLNATAALNLVMRGLLAPGDHAVTTSMEHNSVMRPLRALEGQGVILSVVPCQQDGTLKLETLAEHLRPETRLIAVNHASNVCGTVLPVREIGELARRRGIVFLVDAAQTAGCWPLDMEADYIDLLAFSGHKELLGPTGTGGLVLRDGFELDSLPPLLWGGTGSRSEQETQPDFLPDKYESGTPNLVGLAGLDAGVRHILEWGLEQARAQAQKSAEQLIAGLGAIPGVRVLGTRDPVRQTATVSFTVEGLSASDVASALDDEFDIMCRPGLQCAPVAHRTLGTFPAGSVRLAPGPFTTEEEIEQALVAVAKVVRVR